MKIAVSSIFVAAVAAQVTIPAVTIPGAGEVGDRIRSGISNAGSDIASGLSAANSAGQSIGSNLASRGSSIIANGLTINLPAFPTASVDTAQLSSAINSVKERLSPDVVSSLRNGQTPSAVASWIAALPTGYQAAASQAWRDTAGPAQTGTPSNNGSSQPGAASGNKVTMVAAGAAAALVGLAAVL